MDTDGLGRIRRDRSRVTRIAASEGGVKATVCPACENPLNFHQPEKEVPNRLLASCTCEECGLWFSVNLHPRRGHFYMIRFPAIWEIQEAEGRGDGR